MSKNKNLPLVSYGLKYKLRIAFYLVSVVPLLVSFYLVSAYIYPHRGLSIDIIVALLISVCIALLGFFFIKNVFDRVISVNTEARLIASGDFARRIDSECPDEVGNLAEILNQLSKHIRTNMEELNTFTQKTQEINVSIQKRLIILSSLLQINSLISQDAPLEEMLKIIIEKARTLAHSDVSYLLLRLQDSENFNMRAVDGVKAQQLLEITIDPGGGIFDSLLKSAKPFIVDKENPLTEKAGSVFHATFNLKNALILPVVLRGRVFGMLGIGNDTAGFSYGTDDVELLDIFAKQISIAAGNDILKHRLEQLEIKDALTNLYNEAFIRARLQEEIRRAVIQRRPCALIVLNIDNFTALHTAYGSLQVEAMLKYVASLIANSISEIDRAGRIGENEFAIVVPEKNKRQAQEIAENIRKKIESAFSGEHDHNKRLTVSGGVSENPLDGIDAEQLIAKAKELLNLAKSQGKNRIVGIIEKPLCQ